MSTQLSRQMILLNQTDKMLNDLYHTYAASVHLSDSVLWVLYILWTEGDGLTQKEICDTWYYSRQTINTCLKHLEKEGYICLAPLAENRKSKQILFTKEGRNFAGKIIPSSAGGGKRVSGPDDPRRAGMPYYAVPKADRFAPDPTS